MDAGHIFISGRSFRINRGTPALIAAAIQACRTLGKPMPLVCLAGDVGLGDGSRLLYRYLDENIGRLMPGGVVVFHYLQPDVDWHNRVLLSFAEECPRARLVADAGFMYAAKMSGQASAYHLFTPDVGELAFLADEKAPHPFYTRGFILHMEDQVPEMIARAYRFQNAAKCLLVKGKKDYVAEDGDIRFVIDDPSVAALEPIGGTGDTVTGIAAALMDAGMPTAVAANAAAKINRLAGRYADPTPATQVSEIVTHIRRAVQTVILD